MSAEEAKKELERRAATITGSAQPVEAAAPEHLRNPLSEKMILDDMMSHSCDDPNCGRCAFKSKIREQGVEKGVELGVKTERKFPGRLKF